MLWWIMYVVFRGMPTIKLKCAQIQRINTWYRVCTFNCFTLILLSLILINSHSQYLHICLYIFIIKHINKHNHDNCYEYNDLILTICLKDHDHHWEDPLLLSGSSSSWRLFSIVSSLLQVFIGKGRYLTYCYWNLLYGVKMTWNS